MKEFLMKAGFSITGAIVAYLEPTIPYLLACTLAIMVDCYTAWALGRRVKKKFPDKAKKDADKVSSSKLKKAGGALIRVYLIVILAHVLEVTIFEEWHVFLPNIVAGAICFSQFLSILENESSCNDARWAQWLSKYFSDKAERHFNIDLNGDGKIGNGEKNHT